MLNRPGALSQIYTKSRLALRQMWAIVVADFLKLRHDPSEIIWRMVQPAVWLLIFGQAMAKVHAIPTGNLPYLDYMAPGILAQSILFVSIFYGLALIWMRDVGALHKILVSPAPRSVLVMGRALAASMRAIPQVVVLYCLSAVLGVDIRWNIAAILGVFLFSALGAALFSTFSLIIAALVKKRERFMGIGQVMTMPLFFASNALYPIDMMPDWIRVLSKMNPLTYQVDALRSLMITVEVSQFGLLSDFCVCFIIFAFLVWIATLVYPKILY